VGLSGVRNGRGNVERLADVAVVTMCPYLPDGAGPTGRFSTDAATWHVHCIMRMNLNARIVPSQPSDDLTENVILLSVRPARLVPGDYSYTTNSDSLLRMLERRPLILGVGGRETQVAHLGASH
jgi:hypothetical protein